jgi:hypothetical protein
MATPFTASPIVGADLKTITLAADLASGALKPNARLGQQVWGNDGKLYVFAQANGAITASTAVCTVNATTFLATNSAGSYTSPATTMAAGDQGWFSKASV